MTDAGWPLADFNPVRRLRVIAAATPGAVIHECVLEAPFAAVWAVASDLEGELPRWLFPDIRSVQLTPTGADRSVVRVVGYTGLRARFDAVLQPGWCLMQSRFLLGGLAATAEDGTTRFAFLGGLRGPARLLNTLARPVDGALGGRALTRFAQRVDAYETRTRT